MMKTKQNPLGVFAVFIVAPATEDNKHPAPLLAVTTRPAGKDATPIGLPGGKVDPGETPEQAALREAAEEGWNVKGELIPFHYGLVAGQLIQWFICTEHAEMLSQYKEQHRLSPEIASLDDVFKSKWGNDGVVDIYRNIYKN